MGIKIQDNGGKNNIPRMEVGVYMARVVRLVDLGVQRREYKGEVKLPQQKLQFTFEFPTELIKVGDEEKPRWMSKAYGVSFTELSSLTPLLKALKVTEEEFKANPECVLNRPCQLTVDGYKDKNGDDKVAIGQATQVMKGMEVAPLFNDTSSFSIDDPDMEMWDTFPNWMKDIIRSAENFVDSPLRELDVVKEND